MHSNPTTMQKTYLRIHIVYQWNVTLRIVLVPSQQQLWGLRGCPLLLEQRYTQEAILGSNMLQCEE